MKLLLTLRLLLLTLVLIAVGCSTSKLDGIKRIRRGMDKAQVLEFAGNPSSVSHQGGLDKWTYLNSSKHPDSYTYIFFDAGSVVYSGPNSETPQLPSKFDSKKAAPKPSEFRPIGE